MSAQPVNPNLPPDHVTVFIDGVELAAPKATNIGVKCSTVGWALRPLWC